MLLPIIIQCERIARDHLELLLIFASRSPIGSLQEDHVSFSPWFITCIGPDICNDLMMVYESHRQHYTTQIFLEDH